MGDGYRGELPGLSHVQGAMMALPMPPRAPSTVPGRSWLDDARVVPVLEVADALGLEVARDGRSFGPCPTCGEAHRSNPGRALDRRGRCRVTPEGNGWLCCSNGTDGCGAKGDGLALVALHLTGRPWTGGDADTARQLRAWYADRGWCAPDNGQPWTPPARPRAAPVRAATPAPRPRPDAAAVAALWARCVPVTADPEVAAWLSGRADGTIDPAAVAALDLARALPLDVLDLPRWASYGGDPWTSTGHRLIVQAWEADPDTPGRLRVASLHARNVRPDCAPGDKAAWPGAGPGSASGLVWATGPDTRAHGLPLVELAEGVPDWLRLVLERATRPEGHRPAVVGIVSGSADPDLAALVPGGWTVAIRTHADPAGDKYAASWAELLRPRGCTLHRQRKANGPAAPSTIAPPADLDPPPDGCASWADWTRTAGEGLADAADGEGLALWWRLCCGTCGGADRVPAPVADLHRRAVEGLARMDLDLYRAKVRELGGENG